MGNIIRRGMLTHQSPAALRVIRSIIQTTFNHIPTRFAIFFSALVLFTLARKAAI